MRVVKTIVVLAVAVSLLSGCSSIKKLTGQRNDTLLPGEREEILPADQQVNPKPGKQDSLSGTAAACDPAVDLNCTSSVDQEAGGSGLQ